MYLKFVFYTLDFCSIIDRNGCIHAIYTHAHTHAYAHAQTHTHTHTHMHRHTHTHTHTMYSHSHKQISTVHIIMKSDLREYYVVTFIYIVFT